MGGRAKTRLDFDSDEEYQQHLKRLSRRREHRPFEILEDGRIVWGRNDAGIPICNAKLRRREKWCQKQDIFRNGRCKLHGGMTPTGHKHGSTVHGRYSKDLPDYMIQRLVEAQNDPELMSLYNEVELLDVRTNELLRGIPSKESGVLWMRMKKVVEDLVSAYNDPEMTMPEFASYINRIVEICEKGVEERFIWAEIRENMRTRTRLVSEERKRLVEMKQMVTLDQLMLILSSTQNIILKYITDPIAIKSVVRDIQELASTKTLGNTTGELPGIRPGNTVTEFTPDNNHPGDRFVGRSVPGGGNVPG